MNIRDTVINKLTKCHRLTVLFHTFSINNLPKRIKYVSYAWEYQHSPVHLKIGQKSDLTGHIKILLSWPLILNLNVYAYILKSDCNSRWLNLYNLKKKTRRYSHDYSWDITSKSCFQRLTTQSEKRRNGSVTRVCSEHFTELEQYSSLRLSDSPLSPEHTSPCGTTHSSVFSLRKVTLDLTFKNVACYR